MNLKYVIIFLTGCMLVLNACKNDIEINAPWKETPVVYGLLDVRSDTQYIRITKTFQNSLDLTPEQAAQISDSFYFDTLNVRLFDLTVPAIPPLQFYRTNNIPKDPGYFASDKNYLYRAITPTATQRIDQTHVYRLEFYNPQSGNTYQSATSIVGKAQVPKSPGQTITINATLSNYVIYSWLPAPNAVTYDAYIRYEYYEYPIGQTPDESHLKYIDQTIVTNESGSLSSYTYPQNAKNLNGYLRNNLPLVAGVERSIKQVKFRVFAGNQDFKTAIDISKPTTILLQIKPEFSNVEGGLGLFASRSVNQSVVPFDNEESKKRLTQGVPNFPQ